MTRRAWHGRQVANVNSFAASQVRSFSGAQGLFVPQGPQRPAPYSVNGWLPDLSPSAGESSHRAAIAGRGLKTKLVVAIGAGGGLLYALDCL